MQMGSATKKGTSDSLSESLDELEKREAACQSSSTEQSCLPSTIVALAVCAQVKRHLESGTGVKARPIKALQCETVQACFLFR